MTLFLELFSFSFVLVKMEVFAFLMILTLRSGIRQWDATAPIQSDGQVSKSWMILID